MKLRNLLLASCLLMAFGCSRGKNSTVENEETPTLPGGISGGAVQPSSGNAPAAQTPPVVAPGPAPSVPPAEALSAPAIAIYAGSEKIKFELLSPLPSGSVLEIEIADGASGSESDFSPAVEVSSGVLGNLVNGNDYRIRGLYRTSDNTTGPYSAVQVARPTLVRRAELRRAPPGEVFVAHRSGLLDVVALKVPDAPPATSFNFRVMYSFDGGIYQEVIASATVLPSFISRGGVVFIRTTQSSANPGYIIFHAQSPESVRVQTTSDLGSSTNSIFNAVMTETFTHVTIHVSDMVGYSKYEVSKVNGDASLAVIGSADIVGAAGGIRAVLPLQDGRIFAASNLRYAVFDPLTNSWSGAPLDARDLTFRFGSPAMPTVNFRRAAVFETQGNISMLNLDAAASGHGLINTAFHGTVAELQACIPTSTCLSVIDESVGLASALDFSEIQNHHLHQAVEFDGKLYAFVGKTRNQPDGFSVGSGLHSSSDGGRSWRILSDGEIGVPQSEIRSISKDADSIVVSGLSLLAD